MFINYMLSALKPNRGFSQNRNRTEPNRTRGFFQNRTEVQKSISHIPNFDLPRGWEQRTVPRLLTTSNEIRL